MPDLPQLGTVNTFPAVLFHFIKHYLFVVVQMHNVVVVVSVGHFFFSFFFQYFIVWYVCYFSTELTQQEVSGNSVDVFNPFRNSEVPKLLSDKQYNIASIKFQQSILLKGNCCAYRKLPCKYCATFYLFVHKLHLRKITT